MGKATHVSRITDGQARKEARDTLKLGRRRTGWRFRVLGDPARPPRNGHCVNDPSTALAITAPQNARHTTTQRPGQSPGAVAPNMDCQASARAARITPRRSQNSPRRPPLLASQPGPRRCAGHLRPSRRAPGHRRCARLGRPRFNLSGRTSQVRRCVSFRLTIPELITRESSLNLESIETNLQFSKLLKAIVQQLIVFPINA